MCDANDDCDVQAEVQADEIFNKLPARNVPLTKTDLRKARVALQGKITVSSDKGADRECQRARKTSQ
jgi:hypothetical protein